MSNRMQAETVAAPMRLSRRQVLKGAAGSAFILGFCIPIRAKGGQAVAAEAENAFIKIDDRNDVTLIMCQVEMGQGIYTALSMVLAEELDADWSRVKLEDAPPNERLYANPLLGVQATGGSSSVRAFWLPLRQCAAGARACLVQAAADVLQVPAAELRTENSLVIHDASGRSIAYGALVGRAASLNVPSMPVLKSPKDFRLIGKPLKRLDTPGKTNGEVKYGIDERPSGVKFATLMISPVLGGKVAHVDTTHAKSLPGVQQIVVLDDLVAVVGDHMWAAKTGLDALDIAWNDGPNGQISSALIWARLRAAARREGAVARNTGDAVQALRDGDVFAAEFEMPLLAHACMEPLNCTVHITPHHAEVWIGTQVIGRVRDAVAKVAGLPVEAVKINQHLLGGGFGRRLEYDMAETAARIAVHVDGPVKVVWTREEDIRHDLYRPVYHDMLSAKLEGERITAWNNRITGSAITARWAPAIFKNGIDVDGVDSARDLPYDIPNLRVEFVREEPPGVRTGWWRGVGPNNNVFAIESFVDELANAAGIDFIDFRRAHLDKMPRLRAALDMVREKSDWDQALPQGCGRGVAIQTSFASFIATVVECEVDKFGEIQLRRVTTCVDTGIVINPNTIKAQLEGGIIFGLTAALYGEITLEHGRVQQSNFHDYRMLRIDQIPPIAVHLIPSAEPPGGIGETGTTASIPALRNAIYAATGVKLRRMPVDRKLLAMKARI